MTIVGTAEIQVIAVAGNLEKDIAAKVTAATKQAEKKSKITPKVDAAGAVNESRKLSGALTAVSDKLKATALAGGPLAARLARLTAGAQSLSPNMQVAAYGLAAFAAGAVLSINATAKLGSDVRKFNAITQAGAETSSQFVGALHRLGVEPQTVTASLFRLSNTLKNNADTLAGYGIQVARTSNGSTDLVETFLNVADAVQQTVDPATRAQIAFAAFGRQGAELLPILAKGRAGLQEFFQGNASFSEADLQAIKEYKQATRDLGNELTKLKTGVGKALIPPVTTGLGVFRTIAQGAGEVDGAIRGAGSAIHNFVGGLFGAGSAAKSTAADLGELAQAAAEVARQEAAAAAKLKAQAADLRGAILGSLDAQHAQRDATYGVGKAQRSLADAQQRLGNLQRAGAVDARAVSSANDGLRRSSESLRRAREDLADAERELAEVQKGATTRELQRADLDSRSAALQLTRAQKELTALRKHHRRDVVGIAEAEISVEEAQLAVAEAQDNLTATQNKGKVGSEEYETALEAVIDASERVRDAQTSQADSARSLREAQRGDPDFARNIADAKTDLADAERGVTSAKEAQIAATLNLQTAQDVERQSMIDNAAAVELLRTQIEQLAAAYGDEDFSAVLDALPGSRAGGGDPRVRITDAEGQATGGSINANQWYQVNERGQEFFRSNSSGTVLPVGQGPGQRGGTVKITQHIAGGDDPQTTAQLTAIYTGRALRTAER